MSDLIIVDNSTVLAHIDMTLSDGSAADSTRVNNKPTIINFGDNSVSPAFEQSMLGLKAGDKKTFTLPAVDAFGESNPDNIHYVDKSRFPHEIPAEVGSIVTFTQPGGVELPGMIRSVEGDSVTVDFNHPLAGQEITFNVEIVEVK